MAAESQPFTITRTVLARFAAEQYVRQLWFVVVAVPAFGIAGLIIPGSDATRVFAFFCAVWPITIPLRSYIVTGAIARRFAQPIRAVLTDSDVRWVPEDGKGLRLERVQLKSVVERYGYLVFTTRKLSFALVPVSALTPEAKAAFLRAAEAAPSP